MISCYWLGVNVWLNWHLPLDLADEIARLNQENSTLKKEVDGLLQQAKKDREDFKTQLQVMESSVEEQLAKWEKEIEEKNLEVEDLLSQREAVDKQLKASKEFLQVMKTNKWVEVGAEEVIDFCLLVLCGSKARKILSW